MVKMLKALKKTVLFVSLLLSLIIMVSCASNGTSEWQTIRTSRNPIILQEFLGKYPKSRHSNETKQIIDSLVWVDAREANNKTSYNKYIEQSTSLNLEGNHIKDAVSALDSLYWSEAKQDATYESFYDYIYKNDGPNVVRRIMEKKHVQEADIELSRLDKEFWDTHKASNPQKYLSKMPHGKYKVEARLAVFKLDGYYNSAVVLDLQEDIKKDFISKGTRYTAIVQLLSKDGREAAFIYTNDEFQFILLDIENSDEIVSYISEFLDPLKTTSDVKNIYTKILKSSTLNEQIYEAYSLDTKNVDIGHIYLKGEKGILESYNCNSNPMSINNFISGLDSYDYYVTFTSQKTSTYGSTTSNMGGGLGKRQIVSEPMFNDYCLKRISKHFWDVIIVRDPIEGFNKYVHYDGKYYLVK